MEGKIQSYSDGQEVIAMVGSDMDPPHFAVVVGHLKARYIFALKDRQRCRILPEDGRKTGRIKMDQIIIKISKHHKS